jgi:hypothetical protein
MPPRQTALRRYPREDSRCRNTLCLILYRFDFNPVYARPDNVLCGNARPTNTFLCANPRSKKYIAYDTSIASVPLVTWKDTWPASPMRRFSESATNWKESAWVQSMGRMWTYLHTSCGIVEQRKAALDVLNGHFWPSPLLSYQIRGGDQIASIAKSCFLADLGE